MARSRLFLAVRIGGTALVVGFGLVSILIGLRQQLLSLEDEEVDCEYRIRLTRDRLISQLDRSNQAPQHNPEADDKFANLIRETRDACAPHDPRSAEKLERIEQIFEELRERRRRDEQAREELRAL